MRPPHSRGGVDAGGSETAASGCQHIKGDRGGVCRLCHANWRETEVALNLKKHGMILRESDLGSGHMLVNDVTAS